MGFLYHDHPEAIIPQLTDSQKPAIVGLLNRRHPMARAKQAKMIQQMSVAQWEAAFPDEDACDAFLVAHRWPDGIRCPRCDSAKVYALPSKKWHWECPDCRK